MSKFKRVDMLLNKETGEEFRVDDIVKIKTIGTFSREYVGRIDWIDTLELGLDMSKDYQYRTEKIKLDDIDSVNKVK